MYKKSNLKVILILLITLTVGFSVGYAYLNSTLTINGTSTVQKNTWDTHFDNIKIREGSVTANIEPTVEGGTKISRFDLILQKPGDFYEFTVDVVNGGTLDAMVSNIVKTPDLSSNQQKYLDYKIEYENGEQITAKQLVSVESFVRVKIRVEYKKDIQPEDLPTQLDLVSLGFEINYEQADENGISVKDNGKLINVISGDGTQTSDEICIGEECFYVMYSDESTVTMLAKYNLYVGGEINDTTSIYTVYGDEATGKQDSNMIGHIFAESIGRGTIAFSNTAYWSGSPAYVYNENSSLYSHVENYKAYISDLGVMINDARLISYEELIELGCGYGSCSNAPSWVYTTSYWSGTANTYYTLWYVLNDRFFGNNSYSYYGAAGCRPVIVISKSYF